MNALVSLILAAALILGGGATTVAAQDDLPNQPLYQVKLWTENVTLALTGDPQQQADLLMQMSQTRVQEMAALAEEGIPAPDQVRDRLQDQIHQTLVLASNMDDADLTQTLLQLRDHLQTQDRIMDQLQLHANAETEPLLTQTRLMLQTRLQLVDQALADPQGFRYMMANQMQYGQDEEIAPEPNQQGEPGFHQNGPSEQSPVESGSGNADGQNSDNSQNGNGSGNEEPGGPNPQIMQNNNGGSGSGNEAPNGMKSESQKGSDSSGSGGDSGNCSGGCGGNH